MTDRFNCQNGASAAYFARQPERLVLEGYRHWTRGLATRSREPWDQAALLYSDTLGVRCATTALHALSEFVTALGRCAACPLKTFESGSNHVCRDEVLVMGLIAGIQNHDEAAASLCLTELSCASRCDEVALAAGSFALVLRGLDKTLLPIPAHVVRDILDRSRASAYAGRPSPTLH
ncbi:hypothetical protein HTY61_12350 [Oricola thermophila]|uniref:Uncharacterized protein n=1 Tax=Oricola thermophila TaxID=2742145 RepID=A0A6N1VNY0_9HYPH|nr:hypothetical protein [Oricola thermophila]QKV20647.1 hypothetical protein HTY61_12350 [Oricola thermophila]